MTPEEKLTTLYGLSDHSNERLLKIQENEEKRIQCPKHFFKLEEKGLYAPLHWCKKCGAYMNPTQIKFYVEGYIAAGGAGGDIVQGWDS